MVSSLFQHLMCSLGPSFLSSSVQGQQHGCTAGNRKLGVLTNNFTRFLQHSQLFSLLAHSTPFISIFPVWKHPESKESSVNYKGPRNPWWNCPQHSTIPTGKGHCRNLWGQHGTQINPPRSRRWGLQAIFKPETLSWQHHPFPSTDCIITETANDRICH